MNYHVLFQVSVTSKDSFVMTRVMTSPVAHVSPETTTMWVDILEKELLRRDPKATPKIRCLSWSPLLMATR